MSPKLKLAARDAEDLTVLAACLQDALVYVGDMHFEPDERRFMLVANRFVWEQGSQQSRILSALTFEGVGSVVRRRIDPRRSDIILSLLTIHSSRDGIELLFSGGPAVRLATGRIDVRLADLGDAWPTLWRPGHDLS